MTGRPWLAARSGGGGLRGGDFAGADGGRDANVFRPIDREDVGAGGVVAVGADDIHTATAEAEGLHEARIVERGAGVGVEDDELLTNDVHVGLGRAELGRVFGEDADADVDARVEEERTELGHAHADRSRAGETGDDLGIVAELIPEGQADDEAVGHTAGVGGEGLDLLVDLRDGVVAREGDVGRGGERGERGEDLGLVGGDGGGDEGLGLGLLQAEWIVLASLVALVVVDGDFEGLRETVVSRIAGGELKALGGAADSAGGVDDLNLNSAVEPSG